MTMPLEDAQRSGRAGPPPTRAMSTGDEASMPWSFLVSGLRHRDLILQLTWAQLEIRYRGAWLGWLWLLGVPLLQLVIYTFVFSQVFHARWGTEPGHAEAPFALVLLCGLTLYGLFAECLTQAPALLASYQSHLKQLRFPSEVLAWVCLLSAGVRLAASLLLLAVAYRVLVGPLPPEALLLPLTVVPIALLTLGSVWIFSSLGLFLRDLNHATALLTSALLFLSPIFYPASRVPETFRGWFALNPLAPPLEGARRSLFEGQLPAWEPLAVATAVSFGVAWAGHTWFMRSKEHFVDVL